MSDRKFAALAHGMVLTALVMRTVVLAHAGAPQTPQSYDAMRNRMLNRLTWGESTAVQQIRAKLRSLGYDPGAADDQTMAYRYRPMLPREEVPARWLRLVAAALEFQTDRRIHVIDALDPEFIVSLPKEFESKGAQLNRYLDEALAHRLPDRGSMNLSADGQSFAFGTGFFVTRGGHIVTNNHVVNGCRSVTMFRGSTPTPAQVLATDTKTDLALLRSDVLTADVAPFRPDGREPRIGEHVVAVGYPLYGFLLSDSLVSGQVSQVLGLDGNPKQFTHTAPINHGNSGGPLLDSSGNLVGVTNAGLSQIPDPREQRPQCLKDPTLPECAKEPTGLVNFAIRTALVRDLIHRTIGNVEAPPITGLKTDEQIGEEALKFTVRLECRK